MKMKKSRCLKLLFTLIIITYVMVNFGRISIPCNADNYDNIDAYSYTNADTLLNSKEYTIRDYPQLINTRGGIEYNKDFVWKNYGIDDPIVEIIPKVLFYTEGDRLYIGDEYGFYISTHDREIGFSKDDGIAYDSTVVVFDISIEANLEKTIDRVYVSVEPVFQYKYICMIGNAYLRINSYKFDFELEKPWIIAEPSTIIDVFDTKLEYEMTYDFNIKDISIGASLFNEQDLNRGDQEYDPYMDFGYFFTGFDYSYVSINRQIEDEIQTYADTFMFMLSFADKISPEIAVLGNIYSASMIGKEWKNLKENNYDKFGESIVYKEKKITAKSFYQNREEQLKYYKDDDGNPFLIKKAALAVNTDNKEDKLLFGIDCNATAIFNLNKTNKTGKENNNSRLTRFISDISLAIADKSGCTVKKGNALITKFIDANNKEEVITSSKSNIYLLPNGVNMFTFVPEYSGYYDIKVSISGDTKIEINNEKLSINKALENTKYFKANEEVIIKIYGNAQSQRGTIQIDNSNQLNDIEIESECEYVLSLNGISGVNWIYTNNENLVITKLKYYEKDISLNYCYFDWLESKITLPLKSENRYYVYIKNKSNVKLKTSISIEPVQQIYCDSQNQVVLTSNITYYKVINDNGGQYIFSFFNDYSNEYMCTLLDSNLEVIQNIKKEDRGIYNISLDENKVYYIGITNYKNTNAKIVFKKADNAYSWLIKSNGVTVYDGFDNLIYLERGNSYIVRLKINGEVTNLKYSSEDLNNAPNYNLEVSSEGKLAIPLSTPLGGNGLRVEAENSYGEYFSNKIYIVPTINLNRITMATYNDDDFGFSLKIPKEIKGINYIIDNKIKCEVNNINLESRNTIYQSIKDDYLKRASLNISNIQIKVYELKYIDIYNRVQTKECDLSCALDNNFFYSGNGTNEKPYLINCLRHFENLRKLNDNKLYFKLTNNIICEKNWEPLPEFNGVFDGNNYSINGIKMEISSSCTEECFGLFTKNYGTIKNLIINESGTHTQNQKGFNPNKYIYSGMLCGQNYGSIENCKYISNNINMCFFVPAVYVGGIAGYNSGTILGCYVYSHNVDGYGNKGGICGINTITGNVKNCIFDGLITNRYEKDDQLEQYSVGGFVGINYGEVEYCKNYGKIKFSLGNYPETKLSDSRTMQPRMGLYIGTNYGTYRGNISYTDVDTNGLQVVKWETGALWWKETHTFDQTYYCGNECGENLHK